MSKRPVIVHFHLFKNAGTSIDKVLKDNFKDRWVEIEGAGGGKLDTYELVDYIRHNPKYDAISSHTAVLSVPSLDDINILPIVFMRHPIDRIRSAYSFERRQNTQTLGAIKAKEGNFEHYMRWRLSTSTPWQVSDFHAFRLKDFYSHVPAKQRSLFLPAAMATIDALPIVGRVEEFDVSMKLFENYLKPHFSDFIAESAHENRSCQSTTNLSQNLKNFEDRIGNDVYQRLLEINEDDMTLHKYVKTRFKVMQQEMELQVTDEKHCDTLGRKA